MLLSERLMLSEAVGVRMGTVLPPQRVPLSQSDVSSIVHVGVPQQVDAPWKSAAGGVGRQYRVAALAAVGEGIERYAGATAQLKTSMRETVDSSVRVDAEDFHLFSSEQRQKEGFPFGAIYSDDCPYVAVNSLIDDEVAWVPESLVLLRDDFQTGVPTSSGLAAGPSFTTALLRAIQEVIERDALMVTWLHGLPGRRVRTNPALFREVSGMGGSVYTFDLTPRYSPFPVVAVAGGIKKDGRWRYSLGVACRESWDMAEEKAYLEWNQGVLFAGVYNQYADMSNLKDPYTLRTFDEHAMYYTINAKQWHELAFFSDLKTVHRRPSRRAYESTHEALRAARDSFRRHSMRLYYRNLTTIDAEQLGLTIVKALSPDVAMIFAHQEWPFLNGVDGLLPSRYPHAAAATFPYLMPHPLG